MGTSRVPLSGAVRKRRTLRVDSITIDGFKSLRDQTIHLGLLNVFIGANGSGKTALLEATGVLGAAANGRVDDHELKRRGVRPGVPGLYKSAFDEERIPRVIKLGAESSAGTGYAVTLDNPKESAASPWRFSTETVRGEGKPLVSRSPRGANIWTHGKAKSLKLQDSYAGIARGLSSLGLVLPNVDRFVSTLSEFVIYDPQTAVLRGTQSDAVPVDPIGLGGSRLAEAVNALLVPTESRFGPIPLDELFTLISWAKDIDVSEPSPDILSPSIASLRYMIRFTDRFMRSDRNVLSAYDASEGALYVLFALTLLFHPKVPRFFAIENIDHALHPRLARALIGKMGEHIRASGRQILLTTHNPLVLDGLDLADDAIRLFTVDRTTAGHTLLNRVEYTDALGKARQSGATLSEMWTSGLLGAVPDL